MAHYAKINQQNIVEEIIVADQAFIDSGVLGDPNLWLQTSYNTHGGEHSSGETPFRKNYAGVGYFYDQEKDAFIPPQPFLSWILSEETCLWESPIPYPQGGGRYYWNEELGNWINPEE